MHRILLLTAILASPAFSGGPIIVEEEPPIADVRPQGDGGKWVVPVIVVLGAFAILAGGGSDSPCNGDEPTEGGC